MAKWIDVGGASDFADGKKCIVEADEQSVAMCKVDDEIHAVLNVCPHAHMPIGEGELHGCVLTCPFHGYAFNVKSGKNVDFEHDTPLQKFPVKIEGDRVLIDIEYESPDMPVSLLM